jgi:antitoxin YefM
MAIRTTYTAAREHFADFWRRVEEDRETVVITRRGHRDVALVAADELAGLLETAHLLRSPANARRLLTALHQALGDEGRIRSVAELKRDFGLAPAE